MLRFASPVASTYGNRCVTNLKHESLILYTEDQALRSISESKEHSTNNGFLCEEKQAIQTSNNISEAHEAFYKATLNDISEVQ